MQNNISLVKLGAMSDHHALIQRFLQQQTMVPLVKTSRPQGEFLKAGILPFINEGDAYLFYVMKPKAAKPELGMPPFQLGKGTRQHMIGEEWVDMKEPSTNRAESLVTTALREGIEELGLQLESIKQLYDAGPYQFSSATTGKHKEVWMFAAAMKSRHHFLADNEVAESTAERRWLTLKDFQVAGRKDHLYILERIAAQLPRS